MSDRPVQLIVSDDLKRSRWTVFFRLLLAIPHLVLLGLWGIAAWLVAIVNWVATLVRGQSPDGLHNFLAGYVRYAIQVSAYLLLAANPYPPFGGGGGYPVDVQIAPSAPQNRWKVAFRVVLAIPALMISTALISGSARTYGANYNYGLGLAGVAALLGWFAVLGRARMPRGLRDAALYAISYSAQVDGFLFLLTDVYPDSDPQTALPELPTREDPVSMRADEDLRRSRLTVLFRFPLCFVHLVWLVAWTVLAYLVAVLGWLVTLFAGKNATAIHNFIAAYQRYQCHVLAYLYLIANPFPGFVGKRDSYPVELQIAPPVPQRRLTVLFRIVLVIPAVVMATAYNGLLVTVAVLGWFAGLVTSRMPVGMARAGALALRYGMQTSAYWLILTDSYPYSGPCVQEPADTPAATEPAFG